MTQVKPDSDSTPEHLLVGYCALHF
ncbi:hypothetical protein PSEUDO8AS_10872 [Pseudomonas sp. 8AS]|nr:hypothetical protein PSEUDO8AS_10872 [Pseudomonas sp. 8AS]